ncbi:MAG: TadE family protein [Rubripirellula sp.]
MATLRNQRRTTRRHKRSGVATLEFAIVLPALVALTVGTIDICSMMFLRETAVLAAYEGARQGVGRGRTNADATSRVTEFLDERGVEYDGNVVQISGNGFGGASTLENVTVTVNLPADGNLLIPSAMFGGLTVSADVTMRKEYENLAN